MQPGQSRLTLHLQGILSSPQMLEGLDLVLYNRDGSVSSPELSFGRWQFNEMEGTSNDNGNGVPGSSSSGHPWRGEGVAPAPADRGATANTDIGGAAFSSRKFADLLLLSPKAIQLKVISTTHLGKKRREGRKTE